MSRSARRSLAAVFAVPLALGLASLVGLVAALLGDGLYDGVSWVGLAAPLLVVAWAALRRRA